MSGRLYFRPVKGVHPQDRPRLPPRGQPGIDSPLLDALLQKYPDVTARPVTLSYVDYDFLAGLKASHDEAAGRQLDALLEALDRFGTLHLWLE